MQTDLHGLTTDEAAARLAANGPNELPRARRRRLPQILHDVLTEPMFALLLGSGVIYLVLGDTLEALLLLVFASLSVGIAVIQEARSERTLEALRDLTSPRALVIRDDERRRIAGREVVLGDLVVLSEGDRVPADGTLIEARELLTDESLLTGESVPVRKRAAENTNLALAHQLRDCQYAIDAGDAIFAPRMKALLLRAVVLARRRATLAESTRRSYLRKLDYSLDAIMALAPTNRDGRRLRKRYGAVRSSLSTFLEHPDVPPDNNGSERELRPTATYRKVTGGFRSQWGAELFVNIRSVVGTAARRGTDAYHAIRAVLCGASVPQPG